MIEMSFWSKAFRFTAVFMFLFVAVEVFACDLLPSSSCYISQSPTQHKQQPPDSGDNCICCCAHLVVTKRINFVPQVVVVPAPREESAEQPMLTPSPIDHPPQLS
jgi:hypothetical protein